MIRYQICISQKRLLIKQPGSGPVGPPTSEPDADRHLHTSTRRVDGLGDAFKMCISSVSAPNLSLAHAPPVRKHRGGYEGCHVSQKGGEGWQLCPLFMEQRNSKNW